MTIRWDLYYGSIAKFMVVGCRVWTFLYTDFCYLSEKLKRVKVFQSDSTVIQPKCIYIINFVVKGFCINSM